MARRTQIEIQQKVAALWQVICVPSWVGLSGGASAGVGGRGHDGALVATQASQSNLHLCCRRRHQINLNNNNINKLEMSLATIWRLAMRPASSK